MTWTGQSFSVGQILTAAQMTNLQADITAFASADSGAPLLNNQALEAPTNGPYGPGGVQGGSSSGTTPTKITEHMCPIAGDVQIRYQLVRTGTGFSKARIYKNGSAYGTERSISTSSAVYADNVTVAAGDLVQIYLYGSIAGSSQNGSAVVGQAVADAMVISGTLFYTLGV